MNSPPLTRFLALAQKDAAVQERIAEAAKQVQPFEAITKVAAEAGFEITPAELKAAVSGELSDQQLGSVAGGAVAGFRAPGEWFAETFAVSLQKVKGDGNTGF